MTDAQLTKWAERYGITLEQAKQMRYLMRRYKTQQERSCNGDWHPRVKVAADKDANSTAWSIDSERTASRIEDMARSLGFDRVDFGVGLWPVLEKDGDTCIMVPA